MRVFDDIKCSEPGIALQVLPGPPDCQRHAIPSGSRQLVGVRIVNHRKRQHFFSHRQMPTAASVTEGYISNKCATARINANCHLFLVVTDLDMAEKDPGMEGVIRKIRPQWITPPTTAVIRRNRTADVITRMPSGWRSIQLYRVGLFILNININALNGCLKIQTKSGDSDFSDGRVG